MKSQETCHLDSVNGGMAGSDKQMSRQDTGREEVLKVDIGTHLPCMDPPPHALPCYFAVDVLTRALIS